MNSDEEIRETASRVIQGWRIRKNMSQKDLAEQLGMHQTAIAKIENGDRRIDFATVVRIAKILGIPWDEFDVTAPTDLDVFIQHFTRFQRAAEQWVVHMKAAYDTQKELATILRDIETYIGPSRLRLTAEITEDEYLGAISALLESNNTILDTLESLKGLEGATQIEINLSKIEQFVAKLEKAKNNDSA